MCAQDLRADAVVALIGLEPELLVGLDRVEPLVLQRIRADLVRETDAPAFLIQVEQHAASFGGDAAHGGLRAAGRNRSAPSGTRRP